MRPFILLAVLAATVIPLTPIPGHPPGLPYQPGGPWRGEAEGRYGALVNGWYERYLGRSAVQDPGANGWPAAMAAGTAQESILGGIIGSDEFYLKAGGTDPAFVTRMFEDVTGRRPTPREFGYLMRRLRQGEERTQLAYEFLTLHPEGLNVGAPPAEPDYEYRRPYRQNYDYDRGYGGRFRR